MTPKPTVTFDEAQAVEIERLRRAMWKAMEALEAGQAEPALDELRKALAHGTLEHARPLFKARHEVFKLRERLRSGDANNSKPPGE